MKTINSIKKAISENKELSKKINSQNYYNVDSFISDAKRYIKAIKENRMFCVIDKVSVSGMSRNIHFHECSKGKERYNFYQFWAFFKVLGFTEVSHSNSFRISGCGMDMIFHTNYTIIHRLYSLGFITKQECDKLSQQTPTTF